MNFEALMFEAKIIDDKEDMVFMVSFAMRLRRILNSRAAMVKFFEESPYIIETVALRMNENISEKKLKKIRLDMEEFILEPDEEKWNKLLLLLEDK